MTDNNGILIQNIYYMLVYAFQVLKQEDFQKIAAEKFDNMPDLFAAILIKGLNQQIKQGLYRTYIDRQDAGSVMRGKLNITETLPLKMQRKQLLACEFDELSENNLFNQIMKTTALLLSRESSVAVARRESLKNVLRYFRNVEEIVPHHIPWRRLQYQRNNRTYEMLINLCYFVLHVLLQTTENGTYHMASFSDERMATLFEAFVRAYYRQHYSMFFQQERKISWSLSEQSSTAEALLPNMQADIILQNKYAGKSLIIDTKYYSHTTHLYYDKHRFHSGNLYQIFTYVKNHSAKSTGTSAGLLLYARTEENRIADDCAFSVCGNRIYVKTLNLNQSFPKIEEQLNEIIQQHLQ